MNMRFFTLMFFLVLPEILFSQTITAAQQKALNNYVDCVNNSTKQMSSVSTSVIKYFTELKRYQARPYLGMPRYVCPLQQEEYYFNKAMTEANVLGAGVSATLKERTEKLRSAAAKIDAVCKELDTYHKLQDYKHDNFEKAETLINDIILLFEAWKQDQTELAKELFSVYRKLQPATSGNPYHRTAGMMLELIEHQRVLLDSWTYNLEISVHTGWPVTALETSIAETDQRLMAFSRTKPVLKYPASSMYAGFQEAVTILLKTKRSALDGYNAEAKKSDEHSNRVYLDLINYFNGMLISDYNSFVKFAEQDGYFGLKAIEYCPMIGIRDQYKDMTVDPEPFKDEPYTTISVSVQQRTITGPAATALNNYVDFINECLRQADYMQSVLRNFNSSASYYKNLTSFEGHGQLRFSFEDFKLPLSYFQKIILASSALPPLYAKSLNTQAEVLLNILKEMEHHAVSLETEVKEKRYEEDHLQHVFDVLERYRKLFETVDSKKEKLYEDLRLVYDSYVVADPESSWIVSWKALRLLTDYDRTALFQARDLYKGKSAVIPSTESIDKEVRNALVNEYTNMKGIEKLGRSNGLCPYSPYEDIPATSRLLSEKLLKLPQAKSTSYRHPYHDLVYLYNNVVNDYNKFCELSGRGLLKQIRQPEIFEVKYPEKEAASIGPIQTSGITNQSPSEVPSPHATVSQPGKTVTVVHDTVYIERRDTVYMESPSIELRSMEGYAINNMVLLLDVSGSMNASDKLPLLKRSVLDMLSMMRAEDQISIVIYSGKAKVLLKPTSFKEEKKIQKAIESLESSGKTDGNSGIGLAYDVADKNYIRGGNNRIILATDGEFPISTEVFALVDKFAKEDIILSVFNFGKTSSKNLERLSAAGQGNYEHITEANVELKLIREAKGKRKKG